jgi:hypothetical protein
MPGAVCWWLRAMARSSGRGHLLDGSIARDGISAIETFWFLFWRMSLWGLILLAAVGAAYGFLVGGLTSPYGIGLVFIGPIFGTALGLCVGPLEGLVLWGVTMLHYRGGTPRDSERYQLAAGLACAAVCIVALALIFELVARQSGTSFATGPAYDGEDVTSALVVVVAPHSPPLGPLGGGPRG